MSSALQSGNLSGAQSTFALLQQDAPQLAAQSQNAQTANPRAQAMAALGSALKSGDLSKAQQAFASLQQAMQGGHHHHHRVGGADDPDDSTGISSVNQASSSGAQGTTSSVSSILGSVLNALT